MVNAALRAKICDKVAEVMRARSEVLAAWEGGSAAWGIVDAYSDIDLRILVSDEVCLDDLYSVAEEALNQISPITVRHTAPPGRYYRLKDTDDFLLIDLCFVNVGAEDHFLDVTRHGHARCLFDKAEWLRPPAHVPAVAHARDRRFADLKAWFPVSQSFVRKELVRCRQADAMAAFWACTLRPLAELLRMRYCPVRWDFGMRYLERDLPAAVHAKFCSLLFVKDMGDLEQRFAEGREWGIALLAELGPTDAR